MRTYSGDLVGKGWLPRKIKLESPILELLNLAAPLPCVYCKVCSCWLVGGEDSNSKHGNTLILVHRRKKKVIGYNIWLKTSDISTEIYNLVLHCFQI